MTSALPAEQTPRTTMVGDALLISVAVFGIVTLVELAVSQARGGQPIDVGPTAPIVFIGLALNLAVPPVLAWVFGGRRFGWLPLAGFVFGLVAMGGFFMAITALISLLGNEVLMLWVGLSVAALLSAAFLYLVARSLTRGVKDLRSEKSELRLDWLRVAGGVAIAGILVAMLIVWLNDPRSEGLEVWMFAVLFSYVAGAMVLGADILSGWRSRKAPEKPISTALP